MNWNFVIEEIPVFARALLVTLNVSLWGILLSLIIGIAISSIEVARIPVVYHIARVYVELSRNTPLLVQLYFIYFALPKLGVRWDATQSAIVGLAFLGGSYMAEALRAGLSAVPEAQRESAYMLGFSRVQTFSRVIVPQALSTAMPGLIANVIFLIKESSVVSAIALADIMYETKDVMGNDYNTYEALLLLVLSYLIVLLPISLIGAWLEKRFDYARN
ncbi:amino acid ABC transporter permease [Alloscardovia venturai]|uniref:Amino acid ABC transporter permease n=1 Tax=Alloscardovia venturai TaxID=1769421 RepID=A0ABW2YC21_9BIFI